MQPLVQRVAPVGADPAADPAGAKRPQGRRAVGVGVEAQRGHQRVEDDVALERQGHGVRAPQPQVVQRLRVRSLVQMRPVIGDLGADRGLRARLADVGPGAVEQRRAQVRRRRLEREQRAEGVEQDRARFRRHE